MSAHHDPIADQDSVFVLLAKTAAERRVEDLAFATDPIPAACPGEDYSTLIGYQSGISFLASISRSS